MSNKVKEKLQAGGVATIVGGHSQIGDTIDFVGPLGFDGFWLEAEHGPVSWHQLGDLSRACDLWGLASVLRLHANEPGLITRALDRGVNGIVIPHVNTKAEAERMVQAAKFAPIGQRGMYRGRRGYNNPDYFTTANDETLLIVLIEEMQAIENLAEILTVDHIDVFFIAPSDLAQTMGYVGQPTHPEVVKVVEAGLRQITAAGRVAGTLSIDAYLEQYLQAGARCFLTSLDAWITDGAQRYLANMTELAASL
jgi:4-hydroxy-2-oxoheptanedioate aldolase